MPATSREPGGGQSGDTFMFGSVRAMAVVFPNDDGSLPTAGSSAAASAAAGNAGYPAGATPVTSTSGNVANASAVATLPGVAGKRTYITGFSITGGGATSAALLTAVLSGLVSGSLNYTVGVVAGVLLPNSSVSQDFSVPVPASALNTAIVMTVPAAGAGNTNMTVNVRGYQL